MRIRPAALEDLAGLLALYRELQPGDPPLDPADERVREHWRGLLADTRVQTFVAEKTGATGTELVATCALVLVPNLTRGLRSYALIENVVTASLHRRRGLGTAVLRAALAAAWDAGCYKVMLSTGSRSEETLRLYEKAGFQRGVKTGLIAYPADQRPP